MLKLYMLKVFFIYLGNIKFKNGNYYEGELMYGNLHGEGKFIFKNGIKYEGEFRFNKITGKVLLNFFEFYN